MDSWGKFEEIKLQPKTEFYSKLNMKGIGDNAYEQVQQVWYTVVKNNLLKADVLLLAEVFETFQNEWLEHYKLCTAHFYSAPGCWKDSFWLLWAWSIIYDSI